MKMSSVSLCLILSFLLIKFDPARSQVTFNKINSPLGSFSGFVGGVAQDRDGFMWIATQGGLYRYDGYKFKAYLYDPANSNSLSSNHLEMVYVAADNIIWIATWINGLDRLDPVTGTFTHFAHDPDNAGSLSNDTVRSILQDHDGTLWIGTFSGLDKYNSKTGTFKNYHYDSRDSNSLSCNRVRKIYEDREGRLWIGTGSVFDNEGGETDEGGLNLFNKKTGKFIRYKHDPNNPNSLINNKVQAIYEDSRGVFWVGTAGDGLHTMDRMNGKFDRHLYDPRHRDKLSRPPLNYRSGFTDFITAITEDSTGKIWIGTLAGGLNRYDPQTKKITHYESDESSGFRSKSAWTFCNSRDGILWIGSYEGELYNVDPYHNNIPHINLGDAVWSFNEQLSDNLWIGTRQGLILKNKNSGTFIKFVNESTNSNSLIDNWVFSLYKDKKGILWVGTADGLNRYNPSNNTFKRYENNPGDTSSISVGDVYSIAGSSSDSLWIATDNSLDFMDIQSGSFLHFQNNRRDTNGLRVAPLWKILSDKSGNVWISSFFGGGLDVLNRETKTFKHFLKGFSVTDIYEDSYGTIWIGTTAGLYKKERNSDSILNFDTQGNTMFTNEVRAITEDNEKNLWIGTIKGIQKINLKNNQTSIFGDNYGVNANFLIDGAAYKGVDGKIYFGDANGYYVVTPDRLITNSVSPQIVYTDFRIGGRSVIPGKNSPLTEPLSITKEISLKHNQNSFSIDFVGIHYSSGEFNRHLYMLENYDYTWHAASNEKNASYFNVPPGHYVFHVKAASSDGVWAEKTIAIVISPPWWRTWWAYTIYALLLFGTIYSIHKFQKDRVIRAERERTRERELEQAKEIEKAYHELRATQAQLIQSEKMASLGELTAGIAHEIQNPLNFVNNFSEVNKELVDELQNELKAGNTEDAITISNNIKENEEKISNHGKRADAIVKGMLQACGPKTKHLMQK